MLDDTLSPLEDDRPIDDVDGPRPPPAWQAWLETAALAALATAASIAAGLGLPWLALAPLLAGLRYGSSLGVACAAAQAAALVVAARWRVAIEVPAAQAMLGWLVAGLVPGQFRDAWARRLHRLATRSRDARQRLGGLARAYHVLSASHDRLQREIPGSPSSLRDALESFARDLTGVVAGPAAAADAGVIASQGARILNLFRVHASVRAATLHEVDADGAAGPAVTALGTGAASADDPLIREAVRLGEVVSVRDLPESDGALAAVPLVDIGGRVHAVVAVRALPFLSLQADTLTLLAVLGGHLGDLMTRARAVSRAVVDGQPTRAFCASVSRSLREARRFGIPSALAIVELDASAGRHHEPRLLARCLAAHRRVTDDAEIVAVGGSSGGGGDDSHGSLRIVVLLRLADATGLRSYLGRIDRLARARAQELGAQCHIRVGGWPLEDAPLPVHTRDVGVGLAALLESAASPSPPPAPATSSSLPGAPPSRRHHGVVA